MSELVVAVTADEVNEAHRLARTSAESAVQYAIRCGELLLAKKAELKHGEFMPWVKAECDFSQATANNYMKAAQNPNALGISSVRHLFPSGRTEPQHQRQPEPLPDNGQTSELTRKRVSKTTKAAARTLAALSMRFMLETGVWQAMDPHDLSAADASEWAERIAKFMPVLADFRSRLLERLNERDAA